MSAPFFTGEAASNYNTGTQNNVQGDQISQNNVQGDQISNQIGISCEYVSSNK
jgi:hypothetical protein